jgi:hypothetical protein
MEQIEEKPVCLVEVIEHTNNRAKPYEFKVNPEALEIIETIKD